MMRFPTKSEMSILRPVMLISEQFFYALANFGVTSLLARHLNISDFALYGAGYTLSMLLINIHQGAICDCLFVFPSVRARRTRKIFLFSGILLTSLSIALALIFKFTGTFGFPIFIGLTIFSSMSFNQYMRRLNQSQQIYSYPLIASITYFVGVNAFTYILSMADIQPWLIMILPQSIGFIFALAVNAIPQFIQNKDAKIAAEQHENSMAVDWQGLRRFSSALAISNIIGWLPVNLYQWLFVFYGQASEASTFRIIQTLLVPYYQIISALGGPISQYFSKNGIDKKAKLIISLLLLSPLFGGAFLLMFGSDLIAYIFGPKYHGLGLLAAFASMTVVPAFAVQLAGHWLRAKHQARIIAAGSFVNLAILVIFGVPLSAHSNLYQIFTIIAAGQSVVFMVLIMSYRHTRAQVR